MCHTGIKNLIGECVSDDFATRITNEPKLWNLIYRDRPQEQLKMRACITHIQDEWWIICFSRGGRAVFSTTDKADHRVTGLQR